MRKAIRLCLRTSGRLVGLLLLLSLSVLGVCAIPVLLLSLVWLN